MGAPWLHPRFPINPGLGRQKPKSAGRRKRNAPATSVQSGPTQSSPTATARLRLLRETTTLRHQPPPPSPLPCLVVAFASLPRFFPRLTELTDFLYAHTLLCSTIYPTAFQHQSSILPSTPSPSQGRAQSSSTRPTPAAPCPTCTTSRPAQSKPTAASHASIHTLL